MKKEIEQKTRKRRGAYVLCILLSVSFSTNFLNAQNTLERNITVQGSIVDEQGEQVIGATILAESTTIGTISDSQGNFRLTIPSDVENLTIAFLGYVTQQARVTPGKTMIIVLIEDQKMLSEVVVVGYGTQRKETLTGSIAVVGNEALVQTPTANISNALVGRIPGIVSNQLSGEAGHSAATIRIRGISTFNADGQEPLIVIDGVQSTTETLNTLDANEIENISVLKDASSTAVYGVKGANGVVIVSTKRGQPSVPKVSMSYRFGVTQLASKLKMLGSYEYALFRNEAINTDMDAGNYALLFSDVELWKFQNNRDYTPHEVEAMNITDAQKQALLNSPALYYASHDYFDEQFGGTSPQHQYNINISGGSDRMQYFVSLGYFNQGGVFKNAYYEGKDVNSNYDRYNLRSNLDIDIFKTLTMSIDFGGQITDTRGILGSPVDGDVRNTYVRHKAMLVNILGSTPFVGPGFRDGKLVSDYTESLNPLESKGGYGYSPASTLFGRDILSNKGSNLNSTIRLNHAMDYLAQGLSVTGTISYNDMYNKGIVTSQSVPMYSVARNPNNPSEILYFGGASSPQSVSDNVYNSKWNRIYFEGKIDYNRAFGDHALTGLLLYNAQKTNYPGFLYNVPEGLIGVASRITYNYDNRYLAELNMGYNGSENFPKGERFGFFPAFSIGWVATNERFFPQNDYLTWLKIRGSYGEVGNDKIGGSRFLYLPSSWSYAESIPGNGYYFGNTNGTSKDPYYAGSYESAIGNPVVTWERAKKANIGIDANFFRDQLSIIGDVFYEKRDNILTRMGTVPDIVAAELPPANIGVVKNKGYELQARWNSNVGKFRYGIGANVSYAANKIEFMDEPDYLYEWMNTTGFAYGQYKGFSSSGFYNNSEEASNRPYISVDGNKVQAGDIRYVDIDGDGIIDSQDRIPIGYSNVPRYTFGSTIDLEYKGFSLSVLFTGSYKGSMPMTSFYVTNPFYLGNGAALEYQYEGRWTPEKVEQGITPTFPRASVRTYDSQNGAMSDFWIRSTEHIRLKNLELGYKFSNIRVLKQYGISGVRLYLSGNNLYTWGSKLIDGFDPEQQDSHGASDGYLYPPTRTYNFGINIQF